MGEVWATFASPQDELVLASEARCVLGARAACAAVLRPEQTLGAERDREHDAHHARVRTLPDTEGPLPLSVFGQIHEDRGVI
jgi:hypothetical protein